MQVKHGINFPHPPPLQLPIPPTPSRRRRPLSTVTGQLTPANQKKKKRTATSGEQKKNARPLGKRSGDFSGIKKKKKNVTVFRRL
jgi:hypothetical protein